MQLIRDRLSAHTTRYLLVILAVSVILRVGAVLVMGNTVDTLPGIYDQVSYHTLAQQVITGKGFTVPTDWWPATLAGQPTAHWSYLYTFYLVLVYSVFGVSPLAARLLQVLIVGLAWPCLAWRLGRRLGGDGIGLLSAAWTAIYGYFIYYSAALMTEPFYIAAILWSLDLAMNPRAEHPYRRWLLIGVATGAAVLLRQSFLLFLPFLLLWTWAEEVMRGRARLGTQDTGSKGQALIRRVTKYVADAVRVMRFPLIASFVVILMILPWTVRNYMAFGRFVLLNTNAGYAFFFANHPIYGTQFAGILPSDVSYQSLIPTELLSLDEAALDSALLKRGMDYVVQDPVRYALLSLSRLKTYFMFWPANESGLLSNVVRVLSFGIALPFMLFGLFSAIPHWRKWSLLYLFVIIYSAIHLLSWALIRYRLPVDAVLILFAAFGLTELVRRFKHGRTFIELVTQR